MIKIGDKVKVIEENLQYENIEDYESIIGFITGYENVFEVLGISDDNEFPVEIENYDGETMQFLEKELEKVEE